MLELKNITKDYFVGANTVHALRGVDIQFRESEFVAILGPSGCGKTTMLNIIGGLDTYTDGDLIINGKSTRDFRDREWDTYRNHSVGFVFQSYNLIPHQTVLQNVEIALTLSGVGRAERRRRAKEVLEQVGLADQLHKKPAEMSGGQMQRVAIARALVNNPDIILADEPTGALDTQTSLQVMDILKEVAKDRLVVMVTHNPELAEKYATRTVRLLDGKVTGDSAPLSEQELGEQRETSEEKAAENAKKKKPSMSLLTSFGLSLKNLFTKKGRTALTAFAGSIGIIGIALIYAVSQGMTMYIDTVQEQTLSSYPLVLQAQEMDMATLLTTFMGKAESAEGHENDAVYQKAMFYEMMNAFNSMETKKNDLKSFRKFLERERADEESSLGLHDAISGVQYTYDTELLIYTRNVDGDILKSDTQQLLRDLMKEYMGMDMSAMMSMGNAGNLNTVAMARTRNNLWQEMIPGENNKGINPVIKKQYDLVYGNWPDRYDQVILVLDENNELDDMTLYAMGLKSAEEMKAVFDAIREHTTIDIRQKKWTYKEICDTEFRTILPYDCYIYDENSGTYTDLRKSDAGLQYLYDNGMTLTVSGIVKPNEDAVGGMLNGAIAYTADLAAYMMERAADSPAVQAQMDSPNTDIFSGLPFKDTEGKRSEEEKAEAFRSYVGEQSEKEKAATYTKIAALPSEEATARAVEQTMAGVTREKIEQMMASAMSEQMGMDAESVAEYITAMSDEDLNEMFAQAVREQYTEQYAKEVTAQMAAVPTAQLAALLDAAMPNYTQEQCAQYFDAVLEFSDNTYESNMIALGYVDPDSPSGINLYAASFADKDIIEDAIAAYNADVEELSRISYTDYVGLMISSITTIINAITYVLIAFVAVSLVVSSIMIGVITLISVQERTKEIGILRAIGASKKNVSSMFNAETVMIGFASGLLGVGVTYLLCLPLNAILHYLTGIGNLSAYLPIQTALVLVLISIVLTLIAGIIPSRSAAKKDPVVALRSE